MSWARMDDRVPHHRKIKKLSDAAFRLWVTGICYCAEYLTDGRVDAADVPDMPKVAVGKKLEEAIKELEDAGLWEVTDGGWEVHDYLDWNPTGDAVKAKKRARSEAGRRGGQSSGKRRSKTEANAEAIASDSSNQNGGKMEAKTNPVPVPVPVPKEPAAAGSRAAAPHDPKNLDQALRMPIGDRARFVEANPHRAPWLCPQDWPELKAFASMACEAMRVSEVPLAAYDRDSGVRALVTLFATFTPAQLAEAVTAIPGDPWFRSRRGLSSFSVEVVRRLLDTRQNAPASHVGAGKRQPDYPGEKTFRAAEQVEPVTEAAS